MRFSKTKDIYKIIRITGSQDNILGISFGENDLEIIEWSFNRTNTNKVRTSKDEVLKQVLSGLESVNHSLGTNYKLSKIYFSPCDSSTNQVYSGLIGALVRHYHSGNEFKEV